MPKSGILVSAAAAILPVMLVACDARAQESTETRPSDPAPATKLEAFKPTAGTLMTTGYDELGTISGISVDVREMASERGDRVRGVVVEVRESQYREERSFIDADEIPELLGGTDALLDIRENPTSFAQFEVRYTTKGEFEIVAFNDSKGSISYAVRSGRGVTASAFIDESGLRRLRGMIEIASQRLAEP